MSREKIGELEEILKKHEGGKILVALRGPPDPDSISSALAHRKVAKNYSIETTILHVEEVSHQENKALLKLLSLELTKYNGENLDFSHFRGYSLVDSQLPDEELIEPLTALTPISIVDHHDKHGDLNAEFTDIDKTVGATATIYALYFKNRDLLDKTKEEDCKLATALIHGIKSDTDGLANAREKDYEAVSYLSKFADLTTLRQISIQSLSPKTMDIIMEAYGKRDVRDTYLLSGVGIVRPSERDAIPQAADFLLRRAGIDTVLVYGVVDNRIDCSFRTTSDSITPSDFIREAFPEVEEGQYGGRYDKGGFQIPIGILTALGGTEDNVKMLCETVDRYMKIRFYQKLGIKEIKEES